MDIQIIFSPFWQTKPNEIDILFDYLSEHGFCPNYAPSSGLWHKYDLPYIGISDEEKEIVREKYFDGVLGIYTSVGHNWDHEGRIVLFIKNIEKVADEYAKEFQLSVQDCIVDLTKIVMLHEIGLWLFHYMPANGSFNNRHYDQICHELHESIGQHFVIKGIEKNESLKRMFDWLIKDNPPYNIILDFEPAAIVALRRMNFENVPLTLKAFEEFLVKYQGFVASQNFLYF